MEKSLPPLAMLNPKCKTILHKSQPNPVLSGQFTDITVGSPAFSAGLITTTSSLKIPIFFPFPFSSLCSFALFFASKDWAFPPSLSLFCFLIYFVVQFWSKRIEVSVNSSERNKTQDITENKKFKKEIYYYYFLFLCFSVSFHVIFNFSPNFRGNIY